MYTNQHYIDGINPNTDPISLKKNTAAHKADPTGKLTVFSDGEGANQLESKEGKTW